MIHHIVALRFNPGTTPDQISALGTALLGMRGQIPEVREVYWAPNQAPGDREYSHVLTVVVDDMGAVARYSAHPVHQDVVARFLAPIREARLALDIER